MRSAGGRGPSSVRRYLLLLVGANLLLVLVVGAVGIAVTIRSHRSVHYLTAKVEPAVRTNAAALQDLTDMETYVWGYGISGDPGLLIKYHAARDRFESRRVRLERLDALDGQLGFLVDDFELATDSWFRAYADPRIAGPTGPETFDTDRFARGVRLFDEVRETNAAVGRRLAEMSDDAERDTEDLSDTIVLFLGAVLLAAAAISSLIARPLARKVTEPLGALEDTALELAAGRHEARAPEEGPREIVRVASAINKMAEENDRARAVEARVVEQLRALDAVKSDFVSNVSHELRTPLTSILGYLELLEEELRVRSVDSELEMIGATKRNVLRLGELIDDLLALTRSEGHRAEFALVDLAALVRDAITDLRVAATQQDVEIRLGLPRDAVPVHADAGQLTRVVTNLVSNAVKFSVGRAEVEVVVTVENDEAVVTVADHGIGIPAEEMDQLGSRFYRASNAVGMGITGTGLGLRIVQAIVENHQGSLDLRSQVGVGTTARVHLPLAETTPAEEPAPALSDAADGSLA